jgi:Domain of unknown function (DUF4111)/Nucleotidyltransferase domain
VTSRSAPAADALGFAHRLATICSRELGATLASAIVHGSLALDDYTPPYSDIDLLAVVDRSLRDPEIESLIRVVTVVGRDAPARVDLRFVTRPAATRPAPAPPMELYLRFGGSAKPVVESGYEPDLAVELSICRQHGRALHGPEPSDVIGEVPVDWVLRAGDAQLATWQSLNDDAPHASLMVLTACRIWRFSETHTHSSKATAGLWALEREPSLTAVRDALLQRAGKVVAIAPQEVSRVLATARIATAAMRDEPPEPSSAR